MLKVILTTKAHKPTKKTHRVILTDSTLSRDLMLFIFIACIDGVIQTPFSVLGRWPSYCCIEGRIVVIEF